VARIDMSHVLLMRFIKDLRQVRLILADLQIIEKK